MPAKQTPSKAARMYRLTDPDGANASGISNEFGNFPVFDGLVTLTDEQATPFLATEAVVLVQDPGEE